MEAKKKIKLQELKTQSFITSLDKSKSETINGAGGGAVNTQDNCYHTDWTCWSDINGNGQIDGYEPFISKMVSDFGLCLPLEIIYNSMVGYN